MVAADTIKEPIVSDVRSFSDMISRNWEHARTMATSNVPQR